MGGQEALTLMFERIDAYGVAGSEMHRCDDVLVRHMVVAGDEDLFEEEWFAAPIIVALLDRRRR